MDTLYLRSVPVDPMTDSASTWVVIAPADAGAKGHVYDVRSGTAGRASDGRLLADW